MQGHFYPELKDDARRKGCPSYRWKNRNKIKKRAAEASGLSHCVRMERGYHGDTKGSVWSLAGLFREARGQGELSSHGNIHDRNKEENLGQA